MEEFKEWNGKYCARTETRCPGPTGCFDCEGKRKEGWRAALEEVLKHKELYIKTWIRKELED